MMGYVFCEFDFSVYYEEIHPLNLLLTIHYNITRAVDRKICICVTVPLNAGVSIAQKDVR